MDIYLTAYELEQILDELDSRNYYDLTLTERHLVDALLMQGLLRDHWVGGGDCIVYRNHSMKISN